MKLRRIGIANLAAILLLGILSGCATVQNPVARDPLEGFNRRVFDLNDGLDQVILKPAATVYKTLVPGLVRAGIGNFFGNLAEPWVAVNAALQLKGVAAIETVLRFATNTVFGLGGVLDIASDMNLERRNEDFGQTLGYWGVPPGPYLVLPLLGSSTVRDGLGLIPDYRADPVVSQTDLAVKDVSSVVRLLDFRARLLKADDILGIAALDKYSFVRDVYLQRRQNLVYDGNEPPEPVEPEPVATKP